MVYGCGYRAMSSILIYQYNPFVVPNNMNYKTHGYNGTNLSITVSTDHGRFGKTIEIIKKKTYDLQALDAVATVQHRDLLETTPFVDVWMYASSHFGRFAKRPEIRCFSNPNTFLVYT